MTNTDRQGGSGSPPADGSSVATADGDTPDVVITANELRRLAEEADGLRDADLRLVIGEGGRPDIKEAKDVGAKDRPTGVGVRTNNRGTGRRRPEYVDLGLPQGGSHRLETDKYDMVLWSEPAAEKFLKAYYVRFYSEDQMAVLTAAIADATVLALTHVYPTFYEKVRAGRALLENKALASAIIERRITDEIWVVPSDPTAVDGHTALPVSLWLQMTGRQ